MNPQVRPRPSDNRGKLSLLAMLDKINSIPALQSLLLNQPPRLQQEPPAGQVDRISLSRPGQSTTMQALEQFVRAHLDEAFPKPEAEAEELEAKILYPSGATPQQVSGTIFRGVSQVIFGAYRRAHPDMTEGELEQFMVSVLQGVDKGVKEARGMLETMAAMNEEVGGAIDETLTLLHEKLNSWFDQARADLFPSQA